MNTLKICISVILLFILVSFNEARAQGKKNESPGQEKKEAVIGSVEEVKEDKITIKNSKKEESEVIIPPKSVKVIGESRNNLTTKDVKPKDTIAIIKEKKNASDRAELKEIKKIYVRKATDSARLKKSSVAGLITSIEGSHVSISHQIQRDRVTDVVLTNTTRIQSKSDKSASASALLVGTRIVAVGDISDDGVLTARLIHIIPGKAVGIISKRPIASESAKLTLSPTLSGTPSSTPNPGGGTSNPSLSPTIAL